MKELFEEFKSVSDEEWRNKLKKDLKGQHFNDLKWTDVNHLEHLPFYRKSDLEKITILEEVQPLNRIDSQWNIYNLITLTDENKKDTADLVEVALHNGADKVLIQSDLSSAEVEHWIKENNINSKLLQVQLNVKKLNLSESLSSSYIVDPISETFEKGEKFKRNELMYLAENKNIESSSLKLQVNLNLYKNAGANDIQELAFGLQHAMEYLDILTESKVPAQIVQKLLQFKVGIGTSYFTEIAKLRALRVLISRLFLAFDFDFRADIVAEVSSYHLSTVDTFNNLVRETIQVMAAALSSCNSIICPSFKFNESLNNEFGMRMARNIQIILKEESYFNKIQDPSAGSYYIENLTAEIIEASWDKFLKLEKSGGLISNYEDGTIQNEIMEMHEQRVEDLMKKKRKMIGVNVYESTIEKADSNDSFEYNGEVFQPLYKRNLSESYLMESKKA